MQYDNPQLIIDREALAPGRVRWHSPSNLAIVKYWGKHGRQLPRNPSLSLTLSAAATDTTLRYEPYTGAGAEPPFTFRFAGEEKPDFAAKVQAFLKELHPIFPFLRQLAIHIETNNSFPHSAGIASSASAMSALALCLCSLERRFFGHLATEEEFLRKASYIARLGSGSASRSVYPHVSIWGKSAEVMESSDDYAIPYADRVDPVFHAYHDDILLISRAEKSVSSRAGHGLMDDNIYADNRYQQARRRLHQLLDVMRRGDTHAFGQLAEAEALTLHALMMTSQPPYLLLEPNTLAAIKHIQAYRQDTGHALYFSLDAGPNLHLLYPDDIAGPVRDFIRGELLTYCVEGRYIADRVGAGPVELGENLL